MKPRLELLQLGRWVTIVLLGFVALSWSSKLPVGTPPDERAHLEANVYVIAREHRFPRTGVDDVAFLSTCRENSWGKLPCTNSYTAFPGVNYLLSAVTMSIGTELFAIAPYQAARLASVLWFCVYLTALGGLGYLVTKSLLFSLIITVAFGAIPQIVYIGSYVNQDVHALALAVLALLLMQRHSYQPSATAPSNLFLLALGVGWGLLASSKYNYFVYAPLIFVWILIEVARRKGISWLTLPLLTAFFVAVPWYLRNYLWYGDLLGESFVLAQMRKYHEFGIAQPVNIESVAALWDRGWFSMSFTSFFAQFDHMIILIGDPWYSLALGALAALFVALVFVTLRSTDAALRGSALGTIFIALCVVVMSLYHSLEYDFQPQGRYLFPVVPMLALWSSHAVRNSPRLVGASLLLFGLSMSSMLASAQNALEAAYRW